MFWRVEFCRQPAIRCGDLMSGPSTYEQLHNAFRWSIPERYNIAADVCDRHAADPNKVALIVDDGAGRVWRMTFREAQRRANRLANLLVAQGLKRGDRVMLLLGQQPWAAIGHVACWKAGLVSVPASPLFGADAITYRLNKVGVRIVITDLANVPTVAEARRSAPELESVFLVDGEESGAESLEKAVSNARDTFTNVSTKPDDPAFINFTSGTTGNPKGALQAHRSMLGHLPGVEMGLDFFPQEGDCMWSPADWAWLAGLMDVLMPAWWHGVPVLTFRAPRFDPEQAFVMIGRHRVSVTLLTPTMLRLMRQVSDPAERYGTQLRVVMSGGEAVGRELHDWAADALKAPINEVFGQTECNMVTGSSARIMPMKPGSIGRALPGHVAAIVDDDGGPVPAGTIGNIAFRSPDPVMMLGYWNDPDATANKYRNDWLITGDLGHCDEDGYLWFHGRADDVITSAGYRIGPSEIEDALCRHPSVVMAAVVGVPDATRTESIKAFVVLKAGAEGGPDLAESIKSFVRVRLAKHEVPREVEFVASLPTTTTGKLMRRVLRDAERARAAKGGS
jgi:acetyl-CoA synthetase